MRRSFTLSFGLATLLLVAACSTSTGASPSASTATSAAATVAPSVAASAAASVAPSASAALTDCATNAVVTPGKFTIGTDNPAYPPYFEIVDPPVTDPWELGDPTTGTGFESAFAYALAEQLGFTKDQVTWTVVPFANSFAPGDKQFDVDINQVSYSPERAQNVDMLRPAATSPVAIPRSSVSPA